MSPVLYNAIINGRFRQVQYLINCGVSINGDDSHCALEAALYIPNARTRDRFFRFLLNLGANYNCVNRETGRNVFASACKLERTNELKTLLSFAPGDIEMNARDANGVTALQHAVSTGSVPLVRLVLTNLTRYGLSADVASHSGLTAYQYAQKFGFHNIADILRTEGYASVHRLSVIGSLPRIAEETTRCVGKDALRSSIAGGWTLHHGGFACQRQQELVAISKQNETSKYLPNRQSHPRFVGLRKRQKPMTNPLTVSTETGMQTAIKFHSEPNAYGRISSNAFRRISEMNRQTRNIDLPSIIGVVSSEMSPSYRTPAAHLASMMSDSTNHKTEPIMDETANVNSAVLGYSGSKRKLCPRMSLTQKCDSTTRHSSATVKAVVETFKRSIGSPAPQKRDSQFQ